MKNPRAISKNQLGAIIAVQVCLVVLLTAYIPLPTQIKKDSAEAYPCQTAACGCDNAVQCWSNCCCHTDAEKLVWAKANSVIPPKWFLDSLKIKSKYASQLKSALPETESNRATGQTQPCGNCSCKKKNQSPISGGSNTEPSTEPSPETTWALVSLDQWQRCQGIQNDCFHIDFDFVEPPMLLSPARPVLERLKVRSIFPTSPDLWGPHPPPRFG